MHENPGPLVFFGTPAFAVPTLDALATAGFTPDLVVTQPSRPVGRGRKLEMPPVGRWAEKREIELLQVGRVRDDDFLAGLTERDPWVAVVVAFGQIFPPRLLAIPRLGCVNLHASLLPRHRGAAPVQAALAAGDEVTGVCSMKMEAGMDTGPVYACRETAIRAGETAGELGPRLAVLGGELMVETLRELTAGTATATPQDESRATYAPRIQKADGAVDWQWSAAELVNRYRAYTPWPGLTTELAGRPVKLQEVALDGEPAEAELAPGTFLALGPDGLRVVCGDGTSVVIGRLQRPGRRALSATEFVNGERLTSGARFGPAPDTTERSG